MLFRSYTNVGAPSSTTIRGINRNDLTQSATNAFPIFLCHMATGKVQNLHPKISFVIAYRSDTFIFAQLMKSHKVFVERPWALEKDPVHINLINENNKRSIVTQTTKLKIPICLPRTSEGSCHRLKLTFHFVKNLATTPQEPSTTSSLRAHSSPSRSVKVSFSHCFAISSMEGECKMKRRRGNIEKRRTRKKFHQSIWEKKHLRRQVKKFHCLGFRETLGARKKVFC